MSFPLPLPADLAGWLAYIEALHPKAIAMGLDRVNIVKNKLNLNPTVPVVIVGGTNGKGSTCAMLERIYHEAGYKVGCYTSPHLLRYNERVRLSCKEISDEALCKAFTKVEQARANTELTYFEFGTLAAVSYFVESDVDVMILEVGLGGRLDAVNVFEPASAIVVSVDLDHMDFLGNTKESIGFEKAGIFRSGITAICGEREPPLSLIQHALEIGAELKAIGNQFDAVIDDKGWTFHSDNKALEHFALPALTGEFQADNAACVIEAINALSTTLPVSDEIIHKGLQLVSLAGRFQKVGDQPEIILDVAHNPHAAQALARNLSMLAPKRTLAVFGMLADKDIAGVLSNLISQIDAWYLADIHHIRGASANELLQFVRTGNDPKIAGLFTNVCDALTQACLDAAENDRIIVFGSFFTVADAMHALSAINQD